MLRRLLLASTVSALALSTAIAEEHPAKLAGHVVLPAATFIDAPADAPADLKTSGKFSTGPTRVEALGSVEGKSRGCPTGRKVPFKGQPV
ncbi:MAG: glycerophosphodiester phosphodiesterase, partial [Hyphomicrobium sp.]|nr:glycerophosphodiester phosphodiesterase [Hyphomicrobium sp.]